VPLKYRLGQLRQKYEGRHFPLKDEAAWRKQISRYWGQVTNLDHYTGEILKSLKKHGVEENTVVVFTSDHGDMMGDFRLLAKGVMYESSTRVPLLIKVPGVADRQLIVEEPVGHIDLVPTLLDILGLPAYEKAQGKSLYPVIKGEEPLADNDVFIEYRFGSNKGGTKFDGLWETEAKAELEKIWPEVQKTYSRAVKERTVVSADLFKLNLTEAAENELYDLNADPHERKNLYYDPAYADKVRVLREKILAWQKRTGDDAEV
jgi:arylsulfatase A-like enzyme